MADTQTLKELLGGTFSEAKELTNDDMAAAILVLAHGLMSMRQEQVAFVTEALRKSQ